MSKIVKKVTGAVGKVVGKVTGGLFGGAAPAAPAAAMPGVGANPWEEYNKGRSQLEDQRGKDLSGLKARLGASGMQLGSKGWEDSIGSLRSTYDKKLSDFGSQEYFSSIRGQGGFGAFSDAQPAPGAATAGAEKPKLMGGLFGQLFAKLGKKDPGSPMSRVTKEAGWWGE